jgi:hypothetical protein
MSFITSTVSIATRLEIIWWSRYYSLPSVHDFRSYIHYPILNSIIETIISTIYLIIIIFYF